jgi:hypothetical protein
MVLYKFRKVLPSNANVSKREIAFFARIEMILSTPKHTDANNIQVFIFSGVLTLTFQHTYADHNFQDLQAGQVRSEVI